jgi:hypothetical protein
MEKTALNRNPNLSISFFERHIDEVIWSQLSQNTFNLKQKTLKEIKETNYFYFDKLWKTDRI